jgi:hypothetical protein
MMNLEQYEQLFMKLLRDLKQTQDHDVLKSKLQITITIIRASDLRLMANIELLTSELLDLMNDEHMSDELKELILQVRRGYSTSKLFRHNIRAVL